MNIGTASKLTGLSIKSIRLYEEKGVITPPYRSDSGYREYTEAHIQELNLIARAKSAGFSLAECREFVQLANNPNRKSSEVKLRAKEKLDEIDVKLRQLTEIRDQLSVWVDACPGDTNADCPIIDELTKEA